ncbi:MAG TPA: hypothetical protein VK507_16285 [Iamia sp.]|nr:hypothetical protein [Iamia sp.]
MRNPVKRGSVALATALCLFLALATPASANTVSLTITGGTLTAAGNTFPLGPGGGNPPPCPEKADNLKVEVLGNEFAGTVRFFGPSAPPTPVPPAWSSMFQLGTPPTGQWYQADYFILNQTTPQVTYAVTTAGPPTWIYNVASFGPNHIILQARIYRIATDDCAKDDLACVVNVRIAFTGTLTSTTDLDTFTLGGITISGASVGNMTVASCSAPFASWAGQPASVTGMTLG